MKKKIFEFELCPTSFKFYPVEREKQAFNKINNKISIFLIDINEGRRVLANEVCAAYIPHLEEGWPR